MKNTDGFNCYVTLSNRPANVPPGWAIWNAPRPIYGDLTWQGDFRHGIFYAAIDPAGERAAWQSQENHQLDAWVVEYRSVEDALAWAKDYYRADIEAGLFALADFEQTDITDQYVRHFWPG
jgi:hypothetical protein